MAQKNDHSLSDKNVFSKISEFDMLARIFCIQACTRSVGVFICIDSSGKCKTTFY